MMNKFEIGVKNERTILILRLRGAKRIFKFKFVSKLVVKTYIHNENDKM